MGAAAHNAHTQAAVSAAPHPLSAQKKSQSVSCSVSTQSFLDWSTSRMVLRRLDRYLMGPLQGQGRAWGTGHMGGCYRVTLYEGHAGEGRGGRLRQDEGTITQGEGGKRYSREEGLVPYHRCMRGGTLR